MMRAPLRALALLVCGVVVAAALPAAEGDYGPTIVGGTSSNSERKLAVAGNGTIYATFTEPVGNTTGIAVRRSADGGATWTSLPRLGTGEAFRSCIEVDGVGRVHVAWTEFVGPDRQVFYARWEGGPNWTALQQISDTPGYSGFPSLGLDGLGGIHLVWYGFDGAHYQIYYRAGNATGWQPTIQATHGAQDANSPALAVEVDGKAHVAYYSYVRGEEDVWYMYGFDGNATQGTPVDRVWTLPVRVNPAGVDARDPSIALVGDKPIIAYASGENASLSVMVVQADRNGPWPAPTQVSRTGEGGDHPSIVAAPGNLTAVAYENASGTPVLRARVNGTWGDPVELGPAGSARWLSARWASWWTGPRGGDVIAVWTVGTADAYEVKFGYASPFPEPPKPPCPCGPPPNFLVADLFFVGAAALAAVFLVLWWRRRTRGE